MTAWALTVNSWEAETPDVSEILAERSAESEACAQDARVLYTLGRVLDLGPATLAGSRTPLPTGGNAVSLSLFAHDTVADESLARAVLEVIRRGPDEKALETQALSTVTKEADE